MKELLYITMNHTSGEDAVGAIFNHHKLKANNIILNLENCAFDIPGGMLFGFLVFDRGIEANLEKVLSITNMGIIRDLNNV
jgi:hypothetical protein